MLKTLLFKGACFQGARKCNIKNVRAILIRCDRKDEGAFAFDDLQAVRYEASYYDLRSRGHHARRGGPLSGAVVRSIHEAPLARLTRRVELGSTVIILR